MFRLCRLALLALVLLAAGLACADVVVVVGARSPATALSKEQINAIYFLRAKSLPSGEAVIPLMQAGPAKDVFLSAVLGKTDATMKAYWAKLTFTGNGTAPSEVAKLKAHALKLDDFRLTALSQAAGLSGSALIAFALLHNKIGAAEAYAAATLDDEWSLERWGEDAEARARLIAVLAEFDALDRFITALRA